MSPTAYYDGDLGQFILPYDAVRHASSPDDVVLDYLRHAYEAAAKLGRRDRPALDRPSPDSRC